MGKDKKEIEGVEIDEDMVTELVTASKLVCDKPCWLYAAVSSNINAQVVQYLRDGHIVTDSIKLAITTTGYKTTPIIFNKPVKFTKGLYVQFHTNGLYVFVQYKPEY